MKIPVHLLRRAPVLILLALGYPHSQAAVIVGTTNALNAAKTIATSKLRVTTLYESKGETMQIGAFQAAPSDNIGGGQLTKGVILSTGDVADAPGENITVREPGVMPEQIPMNTFVVWPYVSDDDVAGLMDPTMPNPAEAGRLSYDACVIDFAVRNPMSTDAKLRLRYTFASEEYVEFMGADLRDDAAGIWVNDQNLALLDNTNSISISTANHVETPQEWRDNTTGTQVVGAIYSKAYFQYDGYTVVKSIDIFIASGQTVRIKIGIADGGDPELDAAILIQSEVIIIPPTVNIAIVDAIATETRVGWPVELGTVRISRIGGTTGYSLPVYFTTSGTAIHSPSMDYSLSVGGSWVTTSATIPAGSSSVLVNVHPWWDGYPDGNETAIITLSPSTGYTVGSPNTATVYIYD